MNNVKRFHKVPTMIEVPRMAIPKWTEIKKDEYTFTGKSGWHLLQRISFWFLEKIKANVIIEHDEVVDSNLEDMRVEIITIDGDRLSKYIEESLDLCYSHYGFCEIDKVIMGQRQFNDICGSKAEGSYGDCPIDRRWVQDSVQGQVLIHSILGIDVQVVRNFDSIVVIPK